MKANDPQLRASKEKLPDPKVNQDDRGLVLNKMTQNNQEFHGYLLCQFLESFDCFRFVQGLVFILAKYLGEVVRKQPSKHQICISYCQRPTCNARWSLTFGVTLAVSKQLAQTEPISSGCCTCESWWVAKLHIKWPCCHLSKLESEILGVSCQVRTSVFAVNWCHNWHLGSSLRALTLFTTVPIYLSCSTQDQDALQQIQVQPQTYRIWRTIETLLLPRLCLCRAEINPNAMSLICQTWNRTTANHAEGSCHGCQFFFFHANWHKGNWQIPEVPGL